MSDLLKARIITFFVLAVAMELIVFGALYFYNGVLNETIVSKIGGLADQQVKQARDNVQQSIDTLEGVSMQLMLNQTLRRDLEGTQTKSFDGVRMKVAGSEISELLTQYKYINKDIINIRLLSKENLDVVLDKPDLLYASQNSNTVNLFPQNMAIMTEMIQANGNPYWLPTQKNGFFYPAEMEETKYFPGYSITLARLLKNAQKPKAEMLMVMEVQAKTLGKALENSKIGQNSKVWITDGTNKIIYNADKAQLTKDAPYKVDDPKKSGILLSNDSIRVLTEPLSVPGWHVIVEYSMQEFTDYLKTVYETLLVVISGVVLLIAVLLAWLMNRSAE